ncbi:MAG: DUF5928 domain-containing protein, partial [Pseudomonadota bacterium]
MAEIAFLLMAHKGPQEVIAQARALIAHGDGVAIHWDGRGDDGDFATIQAAFADTKRVVFAPRIRCGWGTWSLVAATLGLMRLARRAFPLATHHYLISGDCYPIKSRSYLERFLDDQGGRDLIETADPERSDWIRTGLREDRFRYRHWFNERERKALFYRSLEIQRRLGLTRAVPPGLELRIGSQWWLLRTETVDRVLEALSRRRDWQRFFRTVWIPDESCLQSLVATLVPAAEIESHPPTHLIFSDYGMPVVFYPEHRDYLVAQPRLFARKISAEAEGLRADLLQLYAADLSGPGEGGGAPGLYGYLTGRGREGARYAPRFWARATAPPASGEILIIAAKLWHVGRAAEAEIARATGLASLGYAFDEDRDVALPLGGLERGLAKRTRHRRAFLNVALGAAGGRLTLCLDPARGDVLADLAASRARIRILSVEREVSDDHLDAHAKLAGLIG